MKRDLDLVRLILLEVEKSDEPVHAEKLTCDAFTFSMIAYHVELMRAHGLLDASISKDWNGKPVYCCIEALTWDGCDYLDAIRNENVWEKTKKVIKETVGSTTLALIKDVAVIVATQAIKARIGN